MNKIKKNENFCFTKTVTLSSTQSSQKGSQVHKDYYKN